MLNLHYYYLIIFSIHKKSPLILIESLWNTNSIIISEINNDF